MFFSHSVYNLLTVEASRYAQIDTFLSNIIQHPYPQQHDPTCSPMFTLSVSGNSIRGARGQEVLPNVTAP